MTRDELLRSKTDAIVATLGQGRNGNELVV